MAKEETGVSGGDDQANKDSARLPPPPPAIRSLKTVPEPEKWVAVPVTPELPRETAEPPEAEPVADLPGVKAELFGEAKPSPSALFAKPTKKIPKRSKDRGLVNKGGLTNGAGGGGLRNRRGMTNGNSLTNGNGMVNGRGLTNGNGMVNGQKRGMVNGRGLTNGNGMVNGRRRGMVNGRGLTNGNGMVNGRRRGMVNGRGLTNGNGMVNGRGRTKGRGLTNGNGMVNGRGLTNGRGIVNGNGMALDDAMPRRRARTGWIAAGVVLSVLVASLLGYFLLVSTEKGVHVDGSFSDWSGVKKIGDLSADTSDPEVDIRETAISVDDNSGSFYVKTDGKMLGGRQNGIDSVYIFIDKDQNTATGYPVDSVGAEYVLMVDGYDGKVSASGLYSFSRDGGKAANDWNSKTAVGSSRAAASGSELEAQVPLSDLGGARAMNAVVYARDSAGSDDFGQVMASGKSSLKVSWRQIGPATAALGQSAVPLLRMELSTAGGPATVSSLRAWANPGTNPTDIGRLGLASSSGQEIPGTAGTISSGSITFTPSTPLKVDASGSLVVTVQTTIPVDARAGRAIGLSMMSPSDVTADTNAVSVEGGALQLTYVGAPAAKISIDGAFSDWDAVASHADPKGDVPDPNVDLTDFRVTNDTGALYFMAKVDGRMMGGANIPESRLRASGGGGGGGGGPVTLPALAGEDSFYLFIDSDGNAGTGYSGGGIPVGGEYMVKMTGQNGRVLERRVHSFTGGSDQQKWSWGDGTEVSAATDATRLESSIALSDIGSPKANISLFYYATDWKSNRDNGERVGYDLRAGAGGRAFTGDALHLDGELYLPGDNGPKVLHAPEFRDVLLPMAGIVGIFVVIRRKRGRRRAEAA